MTPETLFMLERVAMGGALGVGAVIILGLLYGGFRK